MSNNKKIIYQILSFLIPFIVYMITLAPTVTFIDSGELATVASKLGVAHPTGYPFFTVLGRIFTLLPVGDEVYRLNIMSAFLSSAALFMFFNLMAFLLGNKFIAGDSNTSASDKILSDEIIYNISIASVFVLAFSRTFWDTANAIEVYSLHTFFLITSMLHWCERNKQTEHTIYHFS